MVRIANVARPEYIWRPSQIVRRLRLASRQPAATTDVRLAWGDRILVDPNQSVGIALLHLGVFDLPVAEALWRLSDPGENAIDIGAHLGVMSSLLARRCGPGATVHAFEPNPETVVRLQANVKRWTTGATIVVHELAVSDEAGTFELYLPPAEARNDGVASLIPGRGDRAQLVKVCRLDDVLSDSRPTVAKLDVEGAELRALIGAGRILAHVRDLVFEEENYPSRVSDHLESRGFVIRRLDRTLLRPLLAEPRSVLRSGQEGANMLATRDIDRATHRYETVGWKCLRSTSGSALGSGR